jgi:hypothetical protein
VRGSRISRLLTRLGREVSEMIEVGADLRRRLGVLYEPEPAAALTLTAIGERANDGPGINRMGQIDAVAVRCLNLFHQLILAERAGERRPRARLFACLRLFLCHFPPKYRAQRRSRDAICALIRRMATISLDFAVRIRRCWRNFQDVALDPWRQSSADKGSNNLGRTFYVSFGSKQTSAAKNRCVPVLRKLCIVCKCRFGDDFSSVNSQQSGGYNICVLQPIFLRRTVSRDLDSDRRSFWILHLAGRPIGYESWRNLYDGRQHNLWHIARVCFGSLQAEWF